MLGGSFFSPSFPDFTYYCYFTLSLSTFPFLTVLDYRVTSLSISTVTLKVSSPWVPPLSLPPFLDVKSPRHKRHNFVRQRVRLPPKREVFFRSRVNPQKPNILFQFSTLFSKNSLLYPLFTNSYLGKLFSFLLDPFVYLQTVLSFLLGTSLRWGLRSPSPKDYLPRSVQSGTFHSLLESFWPPKCSRFNVTTTKGKIPLYCTYYL